jgi:hypothetical protein
MLREAISKVSCRIAVLSPPATSRSRSSIDTDEEFVAYRKPSNGFRAASGEIARNPYF